MADESTMPVAGSTTRAAASFAVVLAATALLGRGALAEPAPVAVADLAPSLADRQQTNELRGPLTSADIARYRQLFTLLRQGRWADADRLAAELENPVLLGHVLAERYLARKAPRASFAELRGWLEGYGDLPQAQRIYKLALARKPAGADRPDAPVPQGAGDSVARDLWQSGLAAWRLGNVATAGERFTRLARDRKLDATARSRAAFWAARANLRGQHPQLVVPLLRIAADGGDEFYAPLAQKLLDDGVDFDQVERRAAASLLDLTVGFPAARRTLALGQIGEGELAEAELRLLAARIPAELDQPLATLAQAIAAPAVAGAPEPASRRAELRRVASLPLPAWQPAGGYKLDPSLIHAVIRAESGFDPAARSPKGALGLMQVLPDTARDVAKVTQLAYAGEGWLLDPPNNMAVGQAWLRQLAATSTVQGNLVHLLAAYNAGEGRLAGWLGKELAGTQDDPLLFIEGVPLAETRSYIKKVLSSLWAYQANLGQRSPSLTALAENRWPDLAPAGNPPPKPKAKARARAS
jgi:soluble lytic murein transglycosylase